MKMFARNLKLEKKEKIRVKRLIKISLCMLCAFNMLTVTNVFAQDPPQGEEKNQVWGYDPTMNDFVSVPVNSELAESYINIDKLPSMNNRFGRAGVIDQAWAVNGIIKYNQRDSRWAGIKLGGCSSSTIGSAGCAITSFSMALTYNNRFYVTPPDVNTKLGTNACAFDANISASKYGIKANILAASSQMEATAKQIIRGGLKTSKPVMVGMRHVTDSNKSHFVLVYGFEQYSSNSYLHFIYDPEGYNDYGTLEDYMKDWYITRIYTFQ